MVIISSHRYKHTAIDPPNPTSAPQDQQINRSTLLCIRGPFVRNKGARQAQSMDEQYEIGAMVYECIAALSLMIMVLACVQHGVSLPLTFFVVFMAPTIRAHLWKRAARDVHPQEKLPVPERQLSEHISEGNTSTKSTSTQDGPIRDTFPVREAQFLNISSNSAQAENECKGKNKKRVTFADAVTDLDRLRELRRNRPSY
ncbi:hypothetical protein F5Y00DRAFT_261125 [Daldinia vernicosa]|uniref:uncharacterized protein n=1 Tax=Daldinia vernicosa TaxID=114800 RepID=UPI0020082A9C|nr:uncharacterized protein F5Y00DRAFT_261125 [Daldinia vernicosa]KAI0850022.1 hypothetical protein F5Y00DRAFT_261125 [Daldinia vernicosa]